MKRFLLVIASLSLVLPFCTGCHTVQGAGEDLQRAGEKSQRAIDPAGQNP